MKKYIMLPFLFFINFVFSQNIEVKYYENHTKPENLKQLPVDYEIRFLQNTFSYTLTYSNGISFYKNDDFDDAFYKKTGIKKQYFIHDEKVMEEDELGNKVISTGALIDNVQRLKSKELLYYKDFNNSIIMSELNDGVDTYQIIDKPFDWNWQITDEIKEIAGYSCRKAISNLMSYRFEAWFTEDIPVSAGPDKFDGLPGLILCLRIGGTEIIAYSIKFSDQPAVINKPVFKGKTYSFAEVFNGSARKDKDKEKKQDLDSKILKQETVIIKDK